MHSYWPNGLTRTLLNILTLTHWSELFHKKFPQYTYTIAVTLTWLSLLSLIVYTTNQKRREKNKKFSNFLKIIFFVMFHLFDFNIINILTKTDQCTLNSTLKCLENGNQYSIFINFFKRTALIIYISLAYFFKAFEFDHRISKHPFYCK